MGKGRLNSFLDRSISGVIEKNGIKAAFLNNNSSMSLNNSMIGGLDYFDKHLISHLIFFSKKGYLTSKRKKMNEELSFSTRCRYGFGCVQKQNIQALGLSIT